MDTDHELKVFLNSAGLPHLIHSMLENEMTLEVLLQVNENELALLTTKVVDRIKLRSALERLRKKKCSSLECEVEEFSSPLNIPATPSPSGPSGPVALPVQQNATLFYPLFDDENENYSYQNLNTPTTSAQHTSTSASQQQDIVSPTTAHHCLEPSASLLASASSSKYTSKQQDILAAPLTEPEQNYTGHKELSDLLQGGYESLEEFNFSQESCKENTQPNSQETTDSSNNLRRLLLKETKGRLLLEKAEKGQNLTPRDRAFIVKVVVEAELRALDKLSHTIRRDVWLQRANEITKLFTGETSSLYYIPYQIVGGKVIQASGLIHYRLITHRRSLAPEDKSKKRTNSDDSDSGCSSKSSHSEGNIKRVRPLPEGFKVNKENSSLSLEEQLDWLRGSSAPYNTVLVKWRATFELRSKFLETHSFLEYFKTFPALQLPNGYQLALPMHTVALDEHYFAYNVQDDPPEKGCIHINYETMQYSYPCNLVIVGHGVHPLKYIVLRKPL